MVLKAYLNRTGLSFFRQSTLIFLSFGLIFLSGCASTGFKKNIQDKDELPVPEIIKQSLENTMGSDSRVNASHSLTQGGYALLYKKDYDGAIRLLERAVGVNPSDGPGYFYLSEAWIGKKNYRLAFQFNRLALIYLRNNTVWVARAESQTKRINEIQQEKVKNMGEMIDE